MAILVSCAWLVVAIAVSAVAIRLFFEGGFRATGRGTVEILMMVGFVLQPLVALWLIFRAVRLRNIGQPLRIVARALYPLAPVILLAADAKALQSLHSKSEIRRFERLRTGSIAYVCSRFSRRMDYDPKTAGPTEFTLTQIRHPGQLASWTVTWPGKTPIQATSFDARTGSIGGSQGIEWRQPDGRHMIAYLSFSDVLGEFGPASLWVALADGETPMRVLSPQTMPPITSVCGPDPTSYRE